jgi:hypothetical protein
MGRHRTPQEKRDLGARARAMREQGRSRREICAELGVGDELLGRLLAGTVVPTSLRRPQAKDDVRAAAVALRLAGRSYREIADELGVSKSSCSLWLRDVPPSDEDASAPQRRRAERLAGLRQRARRGREERDAEGDAVAAGAAAALGPIGDRDLLIALAVSYWCEGGKRKPWSRTECLSWMNSDPGLVRLYLDGLRLLGVTDDRIACRVSLHETADDAAARAWWMEVTGLPAQCFLRTTWKRHAPRTRRRNVGDGYHGCLNVRVRQSRQLYLTVRGVVDGLVSLPRAPSVAP